MKIVSQTLRILVINIQFNNLQITWTSGKNLFFAELLRKNVSFKDLNGHQLPYTKIPKEIHFFNQTDLKFSISLTTTAVLMMELTIFIPLFAHIWVKQRNFSLKIILLACWKSPKALLKVSDSFREGKNFNKRRKWQAPSLVVETEVHEYFYSEIETDSEESANEVSDEDIVLVR